MDGGSRPSSYEKRPSYQSVISTTVGSARGVPDLSADADPTSCVWVYHSGSVDGESGPWWIVGGTSASNVIMGGIVNSAGRFAETTNAEIATVYRNMTVTTDFFEITSGFCGPAPPRYIIRQSEDGISALVLAAPGAIPANNAPSGLRVTVPRFAGSQPADSQLVFIPRRRRQRPRRKLGLS